MSLYKYYSKYYRKLKNLRGATKLKLLLKSNAARKLEDFEGDAESFFSKKWDNLIILDACRYDYYEEIFSDSQKTVSLGSCSRDFIEKEFSEGNFSDVVYITTNPHFSSSKFEEITGRSVDDVFFEVFHTYDTDWDSEEGTVLAPAVVRDANTAEKLYPEKRKVIHFMQPHRPFVDSNIEMDGMSKNLDIDNQGIYSRARRNEVDKQKVRELYRNNLMYVLGNLCDLELSGKSVITSDHGELLGENGLYAHPCGYNLKYLREVPWHVIPDSNFEEFNFH